MLRYGAIGLELVSPILGGALIGYYLGERFHRPWLGLLVLLGGVFLGFYRLIHELGEFRKGL